MTPAELAALRVQLLGGERVPHGHPARDGLLLTIHEGTDDHFYGAWKGGKASAGGHPVGGGGIAQTSAPPFGASAKAVNPRLAGLREPTAPGAEAKVRASEESIVNRSTERAIIHDRDGNVVYAKSGRKTSVTFTDAQIAKQWDAIVTHNHPPPDGNSLSLPDILMAHQANLREMRAVGIQDGVRYRYRMTKPVGGWPGNGTITRQYAKSEERVTDILQARVDRDLIAAIKRGEGIGSLDKIARQAQNDYHHLVNADLARAIGIQYTREEW